MYSLSHCLLLLNRAYWNLLLLQGMEELGLSLRFFPTQGCWDDMATQIPDNGPNLFFIIGIYDVFPDKVAQR